MSARDRLTEALRNPGLVGLDEEDAGEFVDAFAHELAEKIRTEGAYWGEWSAAGKVYRAAAKLIDPQVTVSAGPVRPDEEPTP